MRVQAVDRAPRHRIGLWVAGFVAVAVMVGAAAVYLRAPAGTGPTATGTTAPPAAPVLTAAMGVQACARQTPDQETPVRLAPGVSNALPNWTPYVDPDGFTLNVPVGWARSRIGSLFCFRDPTSLKTIAVYDHGRLAGDPVRLVDDTSAWQEAASLTGYQRVIVQNMYLPEGGAMLEYTYQRGDTTMHGQNWMMRFDGRLFTVFLLSADSSWAVDRDYLQAAVPSFRVVTPE